MHETAHIKDTMSVINERIVECTTTPISDSVPAGAEFRLEELSMIRNQLKPYLPCMVMRGMRQHETYNVSITMGSYALSLPDVEPSDVITLAPVYAESKSMGYLRVEIVLVTADTMEAEIVLPKIPYGKSDHRLLIGANLFAWFATQ
jgi:hypothetical protein